MRVLVTGGGGWIGQHAVDSLVGSGHEVHVVSRRQCSSRPQATSWQEDLLASDSANRLVGEIKPDAILHMAWETTHGKFWSAQSNMDWLRASLRLVEAAAAHNVRRFVGAGTCAEYAANLDAPADEFSSALVPETLYGTAKDAFRRAAAGYFGQTDGTFAWGRVFMVYGEGEHPDRLVSSISRNICQGLQAPVGPGKSIVDFLHVKDVGGAFAAITSSDVDGPINIGSGQPASIAAVAGKIGELSGHPDLVKIGALPERSNEPGFRVAKIERLRDQVGFHPSIDFDQGIVDNLQYWRQQVAG